MSKSPFLNPGLNEDGANYCLISRSVQSVLSFYAEEMSGRLYIRIFDQAPEIHTAVLDRGEAQRLIATLDRIFPSLKSWEEISNGEVSK